MLRWNIVFIRLSSIVCRPLYFFLNSLTRETGHRWAGGLFLKKRVNGVVQVEVHSKHQHLTLRLLFSIVRIGSSLDFSASIRCHVEREREKEREKKKNGGNRGKNTRLFFERWAQFSRGKVVAEDREIFNGKGCLMVFKVVEKAKLLLFVIFRLRFEK